MRTPRETDGVHVVVAVLAAGASRRLGRPKQLVVVDGEPLVRRTARICQHALGAEVVVETVVVVGAHRAAVEAAAAPLGVRVVVNHAWERGMGSSIACAARETAAGTSLLLVPCDQVALSPSHLARLVAEHAAGAPLVASAYGGVVAIPALFAPRFRPALEALDGEPGARAILRAAGPAVRSVAWPDGIHDLDTEADLARLGATA